jgi:hypothetical protein
MSTQQLKFIFLGAFTKQLWPLVSSCLSVCLHITVLLPPITVVLNEISCLRFLLKFLLKWGKSDILHMKTHVYLRIFMMYTYCILSVWHMGMVVVCVDVRRPKHDFIL